MSVLNNQWAEAIFSFENNSSSPCTKVISLRSRRVCSSDVFFQINVSQNCTKWVEFGSNSALAWRFTVTLGSPRTKLAGAGERNSIHHWFGSWYFFTTLQCSRNREGDRGRERGPGQSVWKCIRYFFPVSQFQLTKLKSRLLAIGEDKGRKSRVPFSSYTGR